MPQVVTAQLPARSYPTFLNELRRLGQLEEPAVKPKIAKPGCLDPASDPARSTQVGFSPCFEALPNTSFPSTKDTKPHQEKIFIAVFCAFDSSCVFVDCFCG